MRCGLSRSGDWRLDADADDGTWVLSVERKYRRLTQVDVNGRNIALPIEEKYRRTLNILEGCQKTTVGCDPASRPLTDEMHFECDWTATGRTRWQLPTYNILMYEKVKCSTPVWERKAKRTTRWHDTITQLARDEMKMKRRRRIIMSKSNDNVYELYSERSDEVSTSISEPDNV